MMVGASSRLTPPRRRAWRPCCLTVRCSCLWLRSDASTTAAPREPRLLERRDWSDDDDPSSIRLVVVLGMPSNACGGTVDTLIGDSFTTVRFARLLLLLNIAASRLETSPPAPSPRECELVSICSATPDAFIATPDAFRRTVAAFAKAATDLLRSLCRLVGAIGAASPQPLSATVEARLETVPRASSAALVALFSGRANVTLEVSRPAAVPAVEVAVGGAAAGSPSAPAGTTTATPFVANEAARPALRSLLRAMLRARLDLEEAQSVFELALRPKISLISTPLMVSALLGAPASSVKPSCAGQSQGRAGSAFESGSGCEGHGEVRVCRSESGLGRVRSYIAFGSGMRARLGLGKRPSCRSISISLAPGL